MEDALILGRWQFAFTATFHYLFPQLTMGLALLIVVLKTRALRGDPAAASSARFFARIFAIAFGIGVVTGIPLEFEFGTNWSELSRRAGDVLGQPLAMEGVFSFFLESTFLGLFLFGERRLAPWLHWLTAVLLWIGTWASGYLIVVAHSWMQRPVGHAADAGGLFLIADLGAVLTNPWALVEYAHVMCGSVVTATFFVAALGAYYVLTGAHVEHGRAFLALAVPIGFAASLAQAFPTGDLHAKQVHEHQPATFASMEGLFATQSAAPVALIGQPDMERRRLDNPIEVPALLSFITYERWDAEVRGLDAFPEDEWPPNVPLVYYAYHIMVGLGTMFIALMGLGTLQWMRGRLDRSRPLLWALLLAFPFPFIANTAGWLTAEVGRQPWLVHGLLRTADGGSPHVSSGSILFTFIGFLGIYAVLAILFLFLIGRQIAIGPEPVRDGA